MERMFEDYLLDIYKIKSNEDPLNTPDQYVDWMDGLSGYDIIELANEWGNQDDDKE